MIAPEPPLLPEEDEPVFPCGGAEGPASPDPHAATQPIIDAASASLMEKGSARNDTAEKSGFLPIWPLRPNFVSSRSHVRPGLAADYSAGEAIQCGGVLIYQTAKAPALGCLAVRALDGRGFDSS